MSVAADQEAGFHNWKHCPEPDCMIQKDDDGAFEGYQVHSVYPILSDLIQKFAVTSMLMPDNMISDG